MLKDRKFGGFMQKGMNFDDKATNRLLEKIKMAEI